LEKKKNKKKKTQGWGGNKKKKRGRMGPWIGKQNFLWPARSLLFSQGFPRAPRRSFSAHPHFDCGFFRGNPWSKGGEKKRWPNKRTKRRAGAPTVFTQKKNTPGFTLVFPTGGHLPPRASLPRGIVFFFFPTGILPQSDSQAWGKSENRYLTSGGKKKKRGKVKKKKGSFVFFLDKAVGPGVRRI